MRIFFTGLGGSGMSSLAWLCLGRGWEVGGADVTPSETLEKLRAAGATVYLSHSPTHVDGMDLVVYSTAVPPDNPEIVSARTQGIPVMARAEFLADQFHQKGERVAVTGSHGKTTTTAMIGFCLQACGHDPAVVAGGELVDWQKGGKWGSGDIFVAEADESRTSFLLLSPTLLVLTNLDLDHLDFYPNLETLRNFVFQLAEKVPQDGTIWICHDENNLKGFVRELKQMNSPVATFGFTEGASLQGRILYSNTSTLTFEAMIHGVPMGEFVVNGIGAYQVKNALATLGALTTLKVPLESIREGLRKFQGVKRRFQFLGRQNGGWIYSDYAHHPTEIRSLLESAKQFRRRLVAVFQPHRYTRTQHLWQELGASLVGADVVIVTDIFPAGEPPIEGVGGIQVAEIARLHKRKNVFFCPGKEDVFRALNETIQIGDIVLFIGAGSIHDWGVEYAQRKQKKKNAPEGK